MVSIDFRKDYKLKAKFKLREMLSNKEKNITSLGVYGDNNLTRKKAG